MKVSLHILAVFSFLSLFADVQGSDDPPIHMNDSTIIGWATGYTDVHYGSHLDDQWKTPHKAVGKAAGTSFEVVSLGRGGRITMTFSPPITNDEGYDFAVFENAYNDTFLELGWVEVSSDNVHFVRFPNSSLTTGPVGGFGSVYAENIYGLAGKFRQGYGTQFDLQHLVNLHDHLIQNGQGGFTSEFYHPFISNFPHLDLNNIGYVRIIDIVGDGSAFDAYGNIIYDPYPTTGSAGFDLDGIAVMNQAQPSGQPQSITFGEIPDQLFSTGQIELAATVSSGLPVSFSVADGPATVDAATLSFTGTGRVTVEASQPGDATYAPAEPVLQSFWVAEKLQHLFIEPIPNLITGPETWAIHAAASSGLPVTIHVQDGPSATLVDPDTHILTPGDETGRVTLRATQQGNETYAPARELEISFDIVEASSPYAPHTFEAWADAKGLPSVPSADSDEDGASNLMEFLSGTDPWNIDDTPSLQLQMQAGSNETSARLNYSFNRQALGRIELQQTSDLSIAWNTAIPRLIFAIERTNDAGNIVVDLTVDLPIQESAGFFRLLPQRQTP